MRSALLLVRHTDARILVVIGENVLEGVVEALLQKLIPE